LLPRLDDPDPEIRTRAAYALAAVNERRLVEPMLAALGDEEYWVRANATMALHRRLKPPPLEGLLARLRGGGPGPINDHAREHAAEALAWLNDPRTFGPLIAALRDPLPRVRVWAAQGLG